MSFGEQLSRARLSHEQCNTTIIHRLLVSSLTVQQVARVGVLPGVTRQVSAFRISTTPPLYLVDTPGIMVPRVETATQGLRLALTGAVPESSLLPVETLVGFMLRVVRLRMALGTARTSMSSTITATSSSNNKGCSMNGKKKTKKAQVETPRSHAVEAWLSRSGMKYLHPRFLNVRAGCQDHIHENGYGSEGDSAGMVSRYPRFTDGSAVVDEGIVYDDGGCNTSGELEGSEGYDNDLEALLIAVERESGAAGKPDAESRRQICCRFLLDAFREGQFGRITLDSVPRRRQKDRKFSEIFSCESEKQKRQEISVGSERDYDERSQERVLHKQSQMSEVLIRDDWSSASAWERPQTRRE